VKPEGAIKLRIVPVTLSVANVYIERWHRHHAPLRTYGVRPNQAMAWFCLATVDPEGIVHGVLTAGRPSNRNSDDGQTIEVHRTATDGTPNAAMGAYRIISYTLETEPGSSLRGAGWDREYDGIVSGWIKKKRNQNGSGNALWRPHMNVAKVRWKRALRSGPITVQPLPSEQVVHPQQARLAFDEDDR
jgi:hypothetical protein